MSNELNIEAERPKIQCDNDHLAALALAGALSDAQAVEVLRAAFPRTAPSSAVAAHVSDEGLPLPDDAHLRALWTRAGKEGRAAWSHADCETTRYTWQLRKFYALVARAAIAAYSAQQQAGPISKAVSLYCIGLEQTVADLRAQINDQIVSSGLEALAHSQTKERLSQADAYIEKLEAVQLARQSQEDPYALEDDDVARFPNDSGVVIVHEDYYWKLRGCEDVCSALGAEPSAPQSGVAQEGEQMTAAYIASLAQQGQESAQDSAEGSGR
jgi:hypothetical protein